MAANLNTFSGTLPQIIYLFEKLSIKIKFVPYIRYQVSAKAKRKTRAHPGKWGNDWMSLSNESKCSGERQSTFILNNFWIDCIF